MSKHYSLIDSHIHLDFDVFDEHRAQLFQQMHQEGLSNIVIAGVSSLHWEKQLKVANDYHCFFALGLHPWYLTFENSVSDLEALEQLLDRNKLNNRLVALGECGLDKRCQTDWQLQLRVFHQQIALAKDYDLPLMLHSVKSDGEMLSILKSVKHQNTGVIHGFSGAPEVAKAYFALGYKLGIGPLLLNSNAKKLRKTVHELPLNAFVIETDLSQEASIKLPYSTNIAHILHSIIIEMAKIHKKSPVLISKQIYRNTCKLYNI
ncbi:TatD family hydrolase [uncultured Shewanella sp.]|uniref:TatD family hydrolase n=1 Tax=uncultured Shewanella sp. TaxID=173975 RepID=UPI00261438D0|nr:TatD family hydrolase [uncultured Shewanella sp.]